MNTTVKNILLWMVILVVILLLFRVVDVGRTATSTVSFTEFLAWEEDWRKTDPDFTTRVVKRGDTLSSIAAEMYDDPGLWRILADANGMDDPRALDIGRVLHVPKTD